MSWFLLAVGSLALYSVTNFIDKFLIEKKIQYASTATIYGSLFSLPIGLLFLAFRGFHLLPLWDITLLITSGVLLTLYIIPYYNALILDDASRVVPLYQFYPVFTLILSSIILHEQLTTKQLLGFSLVTVGGFILGTEKVEQKIFKLRRSFWYMILASLLFACTGIIFKFTSPSDFWLNIGYQTIGIGIGALLLLLYQPYRLHFTQETKKFHKTIYGILMINQTIALIADYLYFYAVTLAPVALVSVVQGSQPLFVLFYGYVLTLWFPHLIKEDIRKKTILLKLFATMLLAIGIFWIFLK